MTSESGNELVTFATDAETGTVRVTDELEAQNFRFHVDAGARAEPAPTDPFVFPVDAAVAVTTTHLRIDPHSTLYVRDATGDHLGEPTDEDWAFERDTYFLEVEGPVKAYVRIPRAAFKVSYRSGEMATAPVDVAFEESTTVQVGARSLHTHPQCTITVPDDPGAVLEAVSYLGSSLKEYSCERSWPTLRGHPPTIRAGDEFDVPDTLEAPDTGVTIEVPAEYDSVYRVAPLAFYLGATLEAGSRPALHLDNGHTEPLATCTDSVEERVEDLLGRCVLLDSLVRIGGYYALPRREYDELGGKLLFYPPNLHGESLSNQLLEFMEVDADTIDPYRPTWPLYPTLRPRVADAELLAPLADLLVPTRVSESGDPEAAPPQPHAHVPEPVRATTAKSPAAGAARLLPGAFENQRNRVLPGPTDASFAFLLADDERADSLRTYVAGQPRLGDATVAVGVDPDVACVERTLASEPDFLYVEPAAGGGAQRLLEAAVVDDKSPPVVALGTSVDPALETDLVESGCVTGLTAPRAPSVEELGRLASRLAYGFSVEQSAALAELDDPGYFGNPVNVLVRRESGLVPVRVEVRSRSLDEHEVLRWTQVTETSRMGAATRLQSTTPNDIYHLTGTPSPTGTVESTSDVVSLLANDDHFVRLNGEPYHGERDPSEELVSSSARRALEERQS